MTFQSAYDTINIIKIKNTVFYKNSVSYILFLILDSRFFRNGFHGEIHGGDDRGHKDKDKARDTVLHDVTLK